MPTWPQSRPIHRLADLTANTTTETPAMKGTSRSAQSKGPSATTIVRAATRNPGGAVWR